MAIVLVGLLLGSTVASLAGYGSGDNEDDREYGVRLQMEEYQKQISRNGTAMFWGVIENIGTQDDNYTIIFGGSDYGNDGITILLYDGLAETDILIPLENLTIWGGDARYFRLEITFAVGEGNYEISMMVQSETDGSIWDAEKTVTQVVEENQSNYSFELIAYQTEIVTGYGILATFNLAIKNTGNVEDSYYVTYDHLDSYWTVEAYLSYSVFGGNDYNNIKEPEYPDPPSYYMEYLNIDLGPGEEMNFMLHVIVYDPNIVYLDGDDEEVNGDEENQGTEDPDDVRDIYSISVLASSLTNIEILKTVETRTIINDLAEERLSFYSYDTEMSIQLGGTAEYFLTLYNSGMSPAEVFMKLNDGGHTGITSELFMILPYWYMDYEDNYYDEPYSGENQNYYNYYWMQGGAYDEEGNQFRPTDDDIVWDDYGGLVPVNENFSYVVYPYESISFLLRITDNTEWEGGDVTPAIYSATYEVSVTAETEEGFHETIMTTTEVIYNPIYGVNLWASEVRKETTTYEPVEYIITLANTGNVEEIVLLELGGSALGLEGVSANLYLMSDIEWWQYPCGDLVDDCFIEPELIIPPVVTIGEDGSKEFYNDLYPYDDWYDYTNGQSTNGVPSDYWYPGPDPYEIEVFIEPGQEIKVVLWVMVMYDEGEFDISVDATVVEAPQFTERITTTTVMADVEYLGFQMDAYDTEQTALAGQAVDYYISVNNPGAYTDELVFELGGKDLGQEGVNAQLYLMNNVYTLDSELNQITHRENGDYYVEYQGGIYDPTYSGQQELKEKYPEFDWNDDPGGVQSGTTNFADAEYFIDESGGIHKNYEYEFENSFAPDPDYPDSSRLVPITGEDDIVNLGPYQWVWLLLRVNIEQDSTTPEGTGSETDPREYNIDVIGKTLLQEGYSKMISTTTTIVGQADPGLELYIGDPVHYTAYGVTTVYVFQLTNTGNFRDTVSLEIDGVDASNPNVYIELGIKGSREDDPIYLIDDYDNVILMNDGSLNDQPDLPGYDSKLYTVDGVYIEPGFPGAIPNPDDGNWNGQLNDDWASDLNDPSAYQNIISDPTMFGFENWGHDDSMGPNMDDYDFLSGDAWSDNEFGDEIGYYNLDNGFIPYQQFHGKYVEIEAGETIIVTMKVTVFDWDRVYYDDTTGGSLYWGPEGTDPGFKDLDDGSDGSNNNDGTDETNGGNGETGNAGNGETGNAGNGINGDGSDEANNNADFMADDDTSSSDPNMNISIDIDLVATSQTHQDVTQRASTTTHIYDDTTSEVIWSGKVSGIFNVLDRILTQEILENGFVIIPIEIGSSKLEIKVSGNFTDGRLMIINLDETNLGELGEFELMFDGESITLMEPEELIDYTGDKSAYALIPTVNGMELIIYIPHFSDHVITVQSVTGAKGEQSGFNGFVLILGIVSGLAFGMASLGYRQRRKEVRSKEFKLKLHEEIENESSEDELLKPITRPQSISLGITTEKNGANSVSSIESLVNDTLFSDSLDK